MNINSKKQILDCTSKIDVSNNVVCSKNVYERPVLQVFGDVRDITLGPTDGLGESGCECLFRSSGTFNPCNLCPPGG